MSERPRVGGLDPRFAPSRPGRVRRAIIFVAIAAGAVAGVHFALSSVPAPNCAAEDGMCKLQRIYLAQAVKVIFAMLAAYVVAEFLVIRLPARLEASRRRRAYELERSLRPAPEPPRPFDASVARAALDRVGQATSLPPAALRALERTTGPPPRPAASGVVAGTSGAGRPGRAPAHAAARDTLAAVNAPTALPPAALAALAGRPALGTPPPSPAPAPDTQAREAARAALEAVSQAPRLPPAALEALMRQGPALGGGRRRPTAPPRD